MPHDSIAFTIFIIFTGTAIFATLALYARQMMIVAYLIVGILLGQAGYGLVEDTERISQISHIGITFLLFLLGVDMSPLRLIKLFRSTMMITGISTILFGLVGFVFGKLVGFDNVNSLVLGTSMVFSSTIIGLKLLPTTVLHHKPTGRTIISILLLQDLIAIAILLLLQNIAAGASMEQSFILIAAKALLYLPLLIGIAWILYRFVIARLLTRFSSMREYIFLLTIGWCLGIAELASQLGLSHEAGAFIAGITLATSPIAFFITESLKPIRDFFLIIFFFTLGANLEWQALQATFTTALLLAALILAIKPLTLRGLALMMGQEKERATEVGFRLGQGSEFSLLIAALALEQGIATLQLAYLIQVTTLISFIASPYFVVLRYPTPIALSEKLRRD